MPKKNPGKTKMNKEVSDFVIPQRSSQSSIMTVIMTVIISTSNKSTGCLPLANIDGSTTFHCSGRMVPKGESKEHSKMFKLSQLKMARMSEDLSVPTEPELHPSPPAGGYDSRKIFICYLLTVLLWKLLAMPMLVSATSQDLRKISVFWSKALH